MVAQDVHLLAQIRRPPKLCHSFGICGVFVLNCKKLYSSPFTLKGDIIVSSHVTTGNAINEVIKAGRDLSYALISSNGDNLICMSAFGFFILRVTLAALHSDFLYKTAEAVNQAVIAAMSGGNTPDICLATLITFIADVVRFICFDNDT